MSDPPPPDDPAELDDDGPDAAAPAPLPPPATAARPAEAAPAGPSDDRPTHMADDDPFGPDPFGSDFGEDPFSGAVPPKRSRELRRQARGPERRHEVRAPDAPVWPHEPTQPPASSSSLPPPPSPPASSSPLPPPPPPPASSSPLPPPPPAPSSAPPPPPPAAPLPPPATPLLPPAAPPPAEPPAPAPSGGSGDSRSNRPILIGGAVVIALAIAVFGLLSVAGGDGDSASVVVETTAVPTTETTVADDPGAPLSTEQLAARFGASVWEVESDGCGQLWGGTAFAIDPNHLVTNRHVVANDVTPTLVSREGVRMEGRVVGWSERPDVAIIETDELLPKWLDWSPAEDLAEGQSLVVLGYPLPEGDFTVTPGTVLSFQVRGDRREAIRSDAAIDRGNSGGPALDEEGRVMGVVTEIAANEGGLQLVPLIYTVDSLGDEIDRILADPDVPELDCSQVTVGSGEPIPEGFDESPATWDSGAVTYGDEPTLDALWDSCAAGDLDACDELWWLAPVDSDYESFGDTCGDRTKGGSWCGPTHGGN